MGRSLVGDVQLVEIARRAIGDGPELLIDAGCPFKAREAIQRAHAFAPYRPFWFEEALEGDDLVEPRAKLVEVEPGQTTNQEKP